MVQHLIVVKNDKHNNKSVHVFEYEGDKPRNLFFAVMELMMNYGINKDTEPLDHFCDVHYNKDFCRITKIFPKEILDTIDINDKMSIENFMLLNDNNTNGGCVVSITDDSFTYGFFTINDDHHITFHWPTDYAAETEELALNPNYEYDDDFFRLYSIPNSVIFGFNNMANIFKINNVLD